MPFSIKYDADTNVLHVQADGDLRLDDFMSYFASLAELDLPPNHAVLSDYSDADVELSYDDIDQMVGHRKSMAEDLKGRIKIAIVSEQDIVYGLARTYQVLLGEEYYDVSVFRHYEEARRWIGL